jgi:hypothetical protein
MLTLDIAGGNEVIAYNARVSLSFETLDLNPMENRLNLMRKLKGFLLFSWSWLNGCDGTLFPKVAESLGFWW